MASVLMVGSGVVGMCGAMMLAKDGHNVTVLERDPSQPPTGPEQAWQDWERKGVSQFRMIHLMLARFRHEMTAQLPEVIEALDRFGALRLNMVNELPDEVTGDLRPDDDRFELITARRPVIEAAVASVAASTPGLTIRRGVAVAGLVVDEDASTDRPPHVTGVRTDDGEIFDAALVVDASGRRSSLPRWLDAVGTALIEDADDSGFVYYGRHLESHDGSLPVSHGNMLHHFDGLSVLTLPCDHGTWGIAVIALASDKTLRACTDVQAWERVVGAYPPVAHWLEGEPLHDGVHVMAKIEDRIRSLVNDGGPVVTGVVALGDAWACTNPSVGRGISIGTMHAGVLRQTVADVGLNDPVTFAQAFHDASQSTVAPYVEDTIALDRHRLNELAAQIAGEPYEPDDASFQFGQALSRAAGSDPEVCRAYLEVAFVLDRGRNVLSRPGMAEKVIELGLSDAPPPGPSRRELEALLAS